MATTVWCARSSIRRSAVVRPSDASDSARQELDVEVADVERVFFDELAARLDEVAHQLGEDAVGGLHLLDLHLEQVALGGIHCRLPQLLGVHLSQSLVALDLQSLA